MTVPDLVSVALGSNLDGEDSSARRAKPLLIVGPSLGTSVTPLWAPAAEHLREDYDVVGWELPGHGRGTPVSEPFTVEDLAEGVHRLADRIRAERGAPTENYVYAGVSVGGAVGLALALSHGDELDGLAAICTGAKIGERQAWIGRAELVEGSGTPTQVIHSAKTWFAPGFLDRQPVVGTELLHSLQEADRANYGLVCRALADFDVRDRLGEIDVPVLTIAGGHDPATPPESLQEIAEGIRSGCSTVYLDTSHLAVAEVPDQAAEDLIEFFRELPGRSATSDAAGGTVPQSSLPDPAKTREQVKAEGMTVRRQVLSDEHVDRAQASITSFTEPFQDLISRYAWGEIWTRPGLDRQTRSAITLTAMIALGHWSEFEMHVKAARRNDVSVAQIQEIILQSAIYCGVPAANTAFARAQNVLRDLGEIR